MKPGGPAKQPGGPAKPGADNEPLTTERALQVLSGAGMVAFGGVGIAASTLPETAAFDVVVAAGPTTRPDLETLLTSASPAGKIYAAAALARISPQSGQSAWRHLLDDHSEVTTASGCLIDRRTVAQYAADQLSRD